METYYWTTEEPHSTNEETMHDYIDNHCQFEVVEHDGTYAEIKDDDNVLWAVHASGNGDFCNHKIKFERLTFK